MFQLVVVAASAGGLAAIGAVLERLPREFPLPIAVVQHVHPHHRSLIAEILARRTPLYVKQASDDDVLTGGVVYVAAPNSHMIVGANRTIQLSDTERVHFVRPSADRLFVSAARECGPVIAVVLSGTGLDGADSLAAIKSAGGIVIAQDQASSAFFGMPQAAIHTGLVDLVLPLEDIGPALIDLVKKGS
jgi:two-component system chemotaxis response regulator CheB